MAKNTSILAAFERMWSHVVAAISGKADVNHKHTTADVTDLQTSLDEAIESVSNLVFRLQASWDDGEITSQLPTGYWEMISNAVDNDRTVLCILEYTDYEYEDILTLTQFHREDGEGMFEGYDGLLYDNKHISVYFGNGGFDTTIYKDSFVRKEDNTPNRILTTSQSGYVTTSSPVTTTELGYLSGVTSNIQTQLDNIESNVQTQLDDRLSDKAEPFILRLYYNYDNYEVTSQLPANFWERISNAVSTGKLISCEMKCEGYGDNAVITLPLTQFFPEDGYGKFENVIDGECFILEFYDNNQLYFGTYSFASYGGYAPNKVLVTDSSGDITESNITTTELGHLSGVTYNIKQKFDSVQSQLNYITDDISAIRLFADGDDLIQFSQSLLEDIKDAVDCDRQVCCILGYYEDSNYYGSFNTLTMTTLELGVENEYAVFEGFDDGRHISIKIDNSEQAIVNRSGLLKYNGLSNDKVLVCKSGCANVSTVTTTELECLSGIESNIQEQLDNKAEPFILRLNANWDDLEITSQPEDLWERISNAVSAGKQISCEISCNEYEGASVTLPLAAFFPVDGYGSFEGFAENLFTKLAFYDNNQVSLETSGLMSRDDYLENRVLITNSTGRIDTSSVITTTELGYLNGVTSNIQDQLDALSAGGTGGTSENLVFRLQASWDDYEVTSSLPQGFWQDIQDAVDNDKQVSCILEYTDYEYYDILTLSQFYPEDDYGVFDGYGGYEGAQHISVRFSRNGIDTTIYKDSFVRKEDNTPNRILTTSQSGYVTESTVTTTELGYLSGVTSNIQNQLNNHNHLGKAMSPSSIELTPANGANHGGYIDFHYNGSSSDKTSRIWEQQEGIITFESAGGIRLSSGGYGNELPDAGIAGRIFFKKV